MKVIFLDVDGVLNSNFWNKSHQREISNGAFIDIDKVKLLSEIVNQTGAIIVMHSGWRFWFDENIKPTRVESCNFLTILKSYGLNIFSLTPDFTTEEIRENKKFSLVKAKEILEWIKMHDKIEKWLVIDDLDLNDKEIGKHQLLTDSTIGLTEIDVEIAIKMLS